MFELAGHVANNPFMPSMLQASHERADAEFQSYGDVPIVSTFGEPQAEYAAIRKNAAIMDMPQRAILQITGKDRHVFLNNLLTNQLYDKSTKAPLQPGRGVYAFFLNNKGRVVSDMNVIETTAATLLDLDARLVKTIADQFNRYLFAEQVTLAPRLDDLHLFFLTGPAALGVLRRSAEGSISDLGQLDSAQAKILGHDVTIYRDDACGVPGFFLIVPASAAESIWAHFTANPPASSDMPSPAIDEDYRFRGLARPMGWAAFNATRIEAGRPLFGIDFDESVLPGELGPQTLARAISFTKGCYLGQEIVARMHARGQVARQLVGIRMEGDQLPLAGTKIQDDAGNEIGGITSSTLSPILSNTAICLGYVKRPHFAPGTKLSIPAEGALHSGTVTALPFLAP